MDTILIITLLINVIFTIIYILWCLKKDQKQAIVFSIFFLLVPVLGLLLYLIPLMLVKISKKSNVIDSSSLINKRENEVYVNRPKISKELDVIPFSEAMQISSINEKRGFLLELLKKDMVSNYSTTRTALEDSDSETSHYAAAATMEISKNLRFDLQEIESEFMKNKTDIVLRRSYIDMLYQFINIDVLSGRDRKIHLDKYIKIIYETMDYNDKDLQQSDYVHLVTFHMELGELYKAEQVALARIKQEADEELYMELLKLYYNQKNQTNFTKTLSQLQNSKIVLSAKGLETVRFWISKG